VAFDQFERLKDRIQLSVAHKLVGHASVCRNRARSLIDRFVDRRLGSLRIIVGIDIDNRLQVSSSLLVVHVDILQ